MKFQKGRKVNFTTPVTNSKQPKLYVVKHKDEIIYVGYTSQSITSRLNYGLKANGKNGYHGYKWKNASDQLELLVFVFDVKLTGDKIKDKPDVDLVEAIEAELVFKIRTETDQWPKYQNEIHFNNYQSSKAKIIAKELFNIVYTIKPKQII